MNYDIAFLSFIIPKEIEKEVRGKSLNRMEEAAIAWQKHIIAGILTLQRTCQLYS